MNPESKTLAILGIFQVGHYVQITRVTVSEGRKCLTTWGQMPRGSCVQEVTQIQNSGRISGLGCRFFSSGPHVPSPVGFPALLCPAFHPDISPLCQPLLGSQTRVLAPFDQQAAEQRREEKEWVLPPWLLPDSVQHLSRQPSMLRNDRSLGDASQRSFL